MNAQRTVTLPADQFDRAHGWIEGVITLVRDLEAETQGEPAPICANCAVRSDRRDRP